MPGLKSNRLLRRLALLASASVLASAGATHALAADTTINVTSTDGPVAANAPAAGDTTTVNVATRLGGSNFSSWANLVLTGAGDGEVIVNTNGLVNGRIDFSGLSGGLTFNIPTGSGNAAWNSRGDSEFSTGDDVLTTSGNGGVRTALATTIPGLQLATIDFLDGDDLFDNGGYLIVGASSDTTGGTSPRPGPSTTTLLNLEMFENTGDVLFGGFVGQQANMLEYGLTIADRGADDALIMPNTDYVGSGDSRFVMDVAFAAGASQLNCTDRMSNDSLPAADCLALPGGSTAGVTQITLLNTGAGDRAGYAAEGIVLIDVTGGTSAAEHFVIAPDSDNYSAAFGGVIDEGLFTYALVYDDADQKHRLVSLPAGAQQFGALTLAVGQILRTSSATFFERQVDLRAAPETAAEAGVWMRVGADFAKRDLTYSTVALDFDQGHEQDTWAISGGLDLVRAAEGDRAIVLGVMFGYAHSDVSFDASPNTAEFNGYTRGVYGSYVAGGMFIDATASALGVTMDNDIPTLGLTPVGTAITSDARAFGVQVEGGWRVELGSGAFIEPLAAFAYTKTDMGEVFAPSGDRTRAGVTLEFEEATSLRAALGGRIGLETDYRGVLSQFSLLARVWNEFDGEAAGFVDNAGPDAPFGDEFSGTFTEVAGQVGLFGRAGISGYLKLGARLADDYQATTASAGFRYAW